MVMAILSATALARTLNTSDQTFLAAESEEKVLTNDDFEGIMKYLYQTCDGPALITCGAKITETSLNPEGYFNEVDKCLK